VSLSAPEIARIAHLSRLALSPAEQADMLSQLNDFFAIVEQMKAVNTEGVVPLAHPVDVLQAQTLRLRDDVASEAIDREANQRSAPLAEDGLYLVPRVIE
jgi:aspartyl-tRNA(Asn)/glutamyl-tRNA(Gln) amidotransferase subunit C